jgi:hypothetical protein
MGEVILFPVKNNADVTIKHPYLVFGGNYTEGYRKNNVLGGWDDFKGRFTTLKNAIEFAKTHYNWYHVVDIRSLLIVG